MAKQKRVGRKEVLEIVADKLLDTRLKQLENLPSVMTTGELVPVIERYLRRLNKYERGDVFGTLSGFETALIEIGELVVTLLGYPAAGRHDDLLELPLAQKLLKPHRK